MKTLFAFIAVSLIFGPAIACAQIEAAPECEILKKDVGQWTTKVKMWNGPGDPEISEGTEVSQMIGDFWLVSDFKGDMMGMPFHGHGMFGYDTEKKQYTGTWIDSFGPHPMQMIGEYDSEANTMTYEGDAVAPDGSAMKHKLVTIYKEDGTRVMTMHAPAPGSDQLMKVMEITYMKKADK